MLLAATVAEDLTSLTGYFGTVITFITGQLTSLVSVVMDNALLIVPIAVIMLYTCIKVFKSLF